MATSKRDPGSRPIVIVGGGHAGLLLALALDHSGLPSTVIEAELPRSILDAPFDGRALALMCGSAQVLENLGLWPAFADLAEPVVGVRVHDEGNDTSLSFDAATLGERAFAYGITNRDLHRRLLELCAERSGIELRAPARLSALERQVDNLVVTLADGARLDASLVVGADGRGSVVRELANIPVQRWSYPQSAITFALELARPHDHCVHESLRAAGPLALLPIGPALCSVTWVEAHAVARRLLASDPATLLLELQDRIALDLEGASVRGQPSGHPLGGLRAARYSAPRIALVGDAAHGLHPIHAQGFNLGVRDIATLAEELAACARSGGDPGSAEVLLSYDRRRRLDAGLTVGFTDGLNRLFSNDLAAAKLLRGLGLAAIERVPPLKQLAMRRGMGMVGDLAKSKRGAAGP